MDSTGSVAVSSDQLTQSCLDGMAWLGMLRSSAPAPVLVEREFRSADLEVVAKLAFPDSCHTEYDTPIETAFQLKRPSNNSFIFGRSLRRVGPTRQPLKRLSTNFDGQEPSSSPTGDLLYSTVPQRPKRMGSSTTITCRGGMRGWLSPP